MAVKANVTYAKLSAKSNVTYAKLSARAAYRLIAGEVSFQAISATEIILDASPLNQYPTNLFTFQDANTFTLNKVSLDTFGFTDAQTFSLQKQVSDVLAIDDTVDIIMQLVRGLTDSTSITDISVIALDKALSETLSFADEALTEFEAVKADLFGFTHAQTFGVEKQVPDALAIDDTVDIIMQFARGLTDSTPITDIPVIASDKALAETLSFADETLTDFEAVKADFFGFTHAQTFGVEKQLVDTLSLSETFSRPTVFVRGFTDTFGLDDTLTNSANRSLTKINVIGLTDDFSFTVVAGNKSTLNASTLNTFTLNR